MPCRRFTHPDNDLVLQWMRKLVTSEKHIWIPMQLPGIHSMPQLKKNDSVKYLQSLKGKRNTEGDYKAKYTF